MADALRSGRSIRKGVWVQIPPSAPPLSDNLILIMFMGDQLDLQYGIVALVISTPVLVFYIVRWWPKIRVNDVPV